MNAIHKKNRMELLILILILMTLFCSACTGNLPAVQSIEGNPQEINPQDANHQDTNSQEATQPIEIVISHSQAEGSPEDLAVQAMGEKLQQLLGDGAEVIIYADYQLGSAEEQLEALQLGRIDLTVQSVAYVSQWVDDMKVLALPYLFPANNKEETRKKIITVLDGVLGQEALQRIGMEDMVHKWHGLGLWFGGYKAFTFHGNDGKRIHSPADFCGLTVAIPHASIRKAQYQHWGAKPLVIDEIARYSVLAQGIADGSEATVSQIADQYLYEVQHNIVQAYHSPEIYTVLANDAWYHTLPSDVQQAIIEAEAYGKAKLYQVLPKQEAAYIERIRQAEGMRYEVLTEKEIAMFKNSVVPLYAEQLAGSAWQKDYVARIQNCFT